jgi:hypothetical protein
MFVLEEPMKDGDLVKFNPAILFCRPTLDGRGVSFRKVRRS